MISMIMKLEMRAVKMNQMNLVLKVNLMNLKNRVILEWMYMITVKMKCTKKLFYLLAKI